MSIYTRKCWNCGSVKMEELGSYYQCLNCGATYNDVPPVHRSIIAEDSITFGNGDDKRREKKFRPSKIVLRQATAARAKKG